MNFLAFGALAIAAAILLNFVVNILTSPWFLPVAAPVGILAGLYWLKSRL